MKNGERVRINLVERSKEIQADVTLERTGENIIYDDILKDTITLFEKAQSYAKQKTMNKMFN